MKLLKLFLSLPLVLLLAGCSPVDSLNPLYTSKNVVFDESLLGFWGSEGEGLDFARQADNGYRIVMSCKDDQTGQIMTVVFEAHLVELQGQRFLDVVWKQSEAMEEPQTLLEVRVLRKASTTEIKPRLISAGMGNYLELIPGESDVDQDRFSVRPRQAHEFFKVVMEDGGTTLRLVQLDDSWIDRHIQDGTLSIAHEEMDGHSAVLTASTAELQRLVLEHVNDDEAFCGETVVKRSGEILK